MIKFKLIIIIAAMQNHKKQGLQEPEIEFLSEQKKIFLRGIPKNFILKSKIQPEHLTCFICSNIIWKAVACSQQNCFANFCDYCVHNYEPQSLLKGSQSEDEQPMKKCPKCDKVFKKTSIPLINSLLSEIQLKCPFIQYGCNDTISYDSYLKHALQCGYRKSSCEGCHKQFLMKDMEAHKQSCEYIIVECEKCLLKLPQSQYKNGHSGMQCLQYQLKMKTEHINSLQIGMEQLKVRLNSYENIIQKIIKGETIPLEIEFYSSFPYNFQFQEREARLIKSSWNQQKQKFDFLHFYLTSSIKTESPVGFQWKINVKVLKGNLLIGICSSLSTNSVDFVINRFGQIKKKESNQNKYKLIRKSNLTFTEGDNITFKYLALRKVLKIENETKRLQSRLEAKEITQLGQNLYSFYSLDTINDSIKFI